MKSSRLTLLPLTSKPQASSPDLRSSDHHALPTDLICAAEDIFETDKVRADLSAALDACSDPSEHRKAVTTILMEAKKSGTAKIEEAFLANPRVARATTRSYTYLTDGIVGTVFEIVTQVFHPNPKPTEAERIALLAVGGYGRGEMAPQSDVDLLFLTPQTGTKWVETVIESMLYILWDLRLKVGHASRTVRDCITLGREDYTIRTALLEHRHLVGNDVVAEELHEALWNTLFAGTGADFIEAKLVERAERHKRHGQRYVVEPNIKEGKGGLRDLQSLFWIAKYIYRVNNARELVALGFFTQDEYDQFKRADTFMWAARAHLHIIAGRPTEQLTFDLQVEVATAMGYKDTAGRRAVEHFMQDFFRHATVVGELTRIFLAGLEQSQEKREPLLVGFFRRKKKVRAGFIVEQNRLGFASEDVLFDAPINILRIFEEALRTGYLLHPVSLRLITSNLHLINDDMRKSKEAQRIFLDLMLKHGNPERALRRMNEINVLGAFIPEFQTIVAMMQFNMYHHYTVDEHTIQVISNLAQIERNELMEELPVASEILETGVNRKVLYVAMLLHDIGKGRDEDHSILGAKIARKVAPRLGLNKAECETVEWLVRYHLLMSDMAQKRDIADPRTVRDFAKAVKTRKRLDLLTVLTVCDIRGVGPGTWNNWKAMLLRSLYHETAAALENGHEAINTQARATEARTALGYALKGWRTKDIRTEKARHYDPYWQGLQTPEHVVFAELLLDIADDEVGIKLTPDTDRDATRACFALADHPGIFSRVTGALALVGANIVDARSFTSKDGYATAAFWIQDVEGKPYEVSRLPRLRKMIERTLAGEVIARDALKDRDKIKKRERAFKVPTSITFDNEGSEIYTIIEIDTRDRPGLLFDLSKALADANVYIANTQVATYGEQAVDSFYVKDMFGLKFHAESKQKALEKRLRDAIEQGAKRALNG